MHSGKSMARSSPGTVFSKPGGKDSTAKPAKEDERVLCVLRGLAVKLFHSMFAYYAPIR